MSKKYINFPITLLAGAFDNIMHVCDNIMDYAIYKHYLSLEHSKPEARINAAAGFFGIELKSPKSTLINGEQLYNKHSPPLAGINVDKAFEYMNELKTEFEVACFCAFCGIKSIVGNKEYCKTNKRLIIDRMFGLRDHKLKSKYSKRHHIDKVLLELECYWGLCSYSNHQRGFYLSFKTDIDDLALKAEQGKASTKKAMLALKKKGSKDKALQHIYNTLKKELEP